MVDNTKVDNTTFTDLNSTSWRYFLCNWVLTIADMSLISPCLHVSLSISLWFSKKPKHNNTDEFKMSKDSSLDVTKYHYYLFPWRYLNLR